MDLPGKGKEKELCRQTGGRWGWEQEDQVEDRGIEGQSMGKDDWNWQIFGGQCVSLVQWQLPGTREGGWP